MARGAGQSMPEVPRGPMQADGGSRMPKVLSYRGGVVLAVLLGASFSAPTVSRAAPDGQAAAGFTLTAAPVGNASAALQWNAQTDAASYRIYGVRTVVVAPATADPA